MIQWFFFLFHDPERAHNVGLWFIKLFGDFRLFDEWCEYWTRWPNLGEALWLLYYTIYTLAYLVMFIVLMNLICIGAVIYCWIRNVLTPGWY